MSTSPPSDTDRLVIAVATTGIFCRPGCPAPAPKAENVTHLPSARAALFAGYRACLRCGPMRDARPAVTDAEIRRAAQLRPVLAAARRSQRRRSGAWAIVTTLIDSPLGPMLAGTTDDGICLLEFTDRRMLPAQLRILQRRLGRPIVAGRHPLLDQLHRQLGDYFAGRRRSFDLPLRAPGSPFQQRAWAELLKIGAGDTCTYQQLARQVGRNRAQRAVGSANGANRIALLIPCHRVIREDGEVGGYGGGRWRKEWLLVHERRLSTSTT